jgi:hypothetical protein
VRATVLDFVYRTTTCDDSIMRTLLVSLVLLGAATRARADLCQSNLMIVLDRSCSMKDPPKAGGAMSKWTIAGAAIGKLTTKYTGKLDFGLIMFPDQTGTACLQDGPIYVNVGAGHEAQVTTALGATMPNGPCVTPIKPAFDQVSTDPAYAMPYKSGPRGFVLFISDGMQTCGGSNAQIVQSLQTLYNNGYPTYIVGFGGAVDPAALDSFATAGGVPRTPGDGSAQLYYQADDAAALDQALDAIASAVVTTEFGSCPGTPCPDGRCFNGETCMSGFCYAPEPDGGGESGNGDGDGGGGGGGPHGSGSSGCGCELGGAPVAPAAAALLGLAFAAGVVWRRRRRRR